MRSIVKNRTFCLFTRLATSRASKAELGARKIYTMQAKTERNARGRGSKVRGEAICTEKATKKFGKVYLFT